MANMGERGSRLVIPNKRHMNHSSFHDKRNISELSSEAWKNVAKNMPILLNSSGTTVAGRFHFFL
jgi:hypothetical protein